ncbi:MAG: DUF732 domain-containing protein [Mycobacterium sp.]|uniref:DUF732 domain-containing protein n=1 Tax=Mycobacterium sp. TaxID=1785 RepID=UPI003F955F0F
MKKTLIGGIAATATALGLATAGPAHADENGYVAELSAHGVPMFAGPNRAILAGYQICGQLRDGASPEIVASQYQYNWILAPFAPTVIDSAQRQLCPDTLRLSK